MIKKSLRGSCLILVLLGTASAALAADEPFVSIFAGYSDNDPNTGAGNTTPFGFRIGTETPVAGGQFAVTWNRDGDVEMNTIMFDLLFHFGSSDARTRRNRILYNRVSGFGIVGLGAMRYDAGPGTSQATIFSWELGLGMQVKFTQRVGLRVQVQSLRTGPNNFKSYSGDLGVAIYF
jgi:opacity protein-like surface antigen